MLPITDSHRRSRGPRCAPRPAHVPTTSRDLDTAVRDGLAAKSRLSPAVTRSENGVVSNFLSRPPPGDASPTHVPATFCDLVAAVRDGLAAQIRLSPAVTRSEMRPPPTSQRRSATF